MKMSFHKKPVIDFVLRLTGNDSNLLVVFYVQIMSNDFVMQFSLQA